MVKTKKILPVFLLILFIVSTILIGCSAEKTQVFHSKEDFEQAKIGVFTGAIFDQYTREYLPEAERFYFNNLTDLTLGLKQGKIDGILLDMAFYTPLAWEYSEISFIEMDMPETEYAVAFPKTPEGEALKAQIDAFIKSCTESGWMAELEQKWFSSTEPDVGTDLSQLTGENGTLRVATTVDTKPFDYLKNGQVEGFDIDFLFHFAKEYGYALEIDTMDFGALLPSLTAQRYDLAVSGFTITDERKEAVLFSNPYYFSSSVMAVVDYSAPLHTERTVADFENAKIGIMTGSSHDGTAKQFFPDAERVYFSTVADMVLAVEQGKVDCYLEDGNFLPAILWEGKNKVERIEQSVKQVDNGFAFPQSEKSAVLRGQINEFISTAKADGTIDALKEKWLGATEPAEHPDYTTLTGENGTIHLAVVVESKPMIYLRNERCTGFEIELLTLFAQRYGYAFEIEKLPFTSVIAGIAAGKYDMAAASLNITPEREESVDFSDPYATFDTILVVKKEVKQETEDLRTLADFENTKIGILTGSVYESYAKEYLPDADCSYFNLISDMLVALNQGKIDGFISESTYFTAALWEGAKIASLSETMDHTDAGYIFPKSDDSALLREQLNTYIRKSKENGSLKKLQEKWLGATEPTEILDYNTLTGENGTLKVAVAPDLKPITYVKDGKPTGYEVELLTMFAKEYGYKLDMVYMTFDAILPGITTGKYDIGTGAVTITEERAQSLDFSDSHLTVDVIMVVKAAEENAVSQRSFWSNVRESFEKTFIREDRWKLIVEGIGVTMLISISAGIAGSMLGFGLYMLSRSDKKLPRNLSRGFAKVYSRIIAGTPVVVILMILFYVVFGKFRDMSGVLVAIIGFTLTFGAFVYDHMTVSVNSVDHGQTEAAFALGYTKNQTFFRIVFPQAMTVFLPSYCGQAVELIKATAVVGYVAVNDLTKMGDIIRSNTYEAFFPLIATAVIYFLLTWILSLLLGFLKRHFEPKRRSKEDILKGVKTV